MRPDRSALDIPSPRSNTGITLPPDCRAGKKRMICCQKQHDHLSHLIEGPSAVSWWQLCGVNCSQTSNQIRILPDLSFNTLAMGTKQLVFQEKRVKARAQITNLPHYMFSFYHQTILSDCHLWKGPATFTTYFSKLRSSLGFVFLHKRQTTLNSTNVILTSLHSKTSQPVYCILAILVKTSD